MSGGGTVLEDDLSYKRAGPGSHRPDASSAVGTQSTGRRLLFNPHLHSELRKRARLPGRMRGRDVEQIRGHLRRLLRSRRGGWESNIMTTKTKYVIVAVFAIVVLIGALSGSRHKTSSPALRPAAKVSAKEEGARTLAREPQSAATVVALSARSWTQEQINELVASSMRGAPASAKAFAECIVTFRAVQYTPEELLHQEQISTRLKEEADHACE